MPTAGIRWRLAVVTVALMVLCGCGSTPSLTPPSGTSPASAPASTSASQPAAPFGAMTIARTGNGFSLRGEVPDETMRTSLPDTIKQAMPGAVIVADLVVVPGVRAPDIGGLGALFGSAMGVQGFSVVLAGDTATLTGTASVAADRDAAAAAVAQTWPNVNVVNQIRAPGAGSSCGTLGADVAAVLQTPIRFATNQSAPAPDARGLIGQIAEKVKTCPSAKLTVVGYTDGTGGDAINVPLSARRAQSVADALVSAGVPAAEVTSRGAGATNPVADDATAAGRAKNRRVEIVVG